MNRHPRSERGAALILRADGNDHPDGARGGARRDHLHGNDHRRQFPEQPPGVLRGRSGRRTRGCGIAHASNWIGSRRRAPNDREFIDGAPGGARALPTDAPVDLTAIVNMANCNAPAPCGGVPRWQLFAYGPLRDRRRRAPRLAVLRRRVRLRRPDGVGRAARHDSGPKPSVRGAPTRPSKSPSPERTPAKPSSCGTSSVDKGLRA